MIFFQTSPVCNAEVVIVEDSLMIAVARNLITFASYLLDPNRVYDVHVQAKNFGGSATSQTKIRKQ